MLDICEGTRVCLALKSWLKERNRKVLKRSFKEKPKGPITPALYPQCIRLSCTSPAVEQWTHQGLKMPLASGGPSPSIGCFTLTSPAITAEGLCLFNSGYLHWVRKLISHTHTRFIKLFYSCQIFISLWEKHHCYFTSHTDLSYSSWSCLSSMRMAVWKHRCNILIIHWFVLNILETLLRCLLLKCWQVLFSELLQRRTGISATLKYQSSVDSLSCSRVDWRSGGSGDPWGGVPDRQCRRRRRRVRGNGTHTDTDFKTWNSPKACLSLNHTAAKYHRWHCLSTLSGFHRASLGPVCGVFVCKYHG